MIYAVTIPTLTQGSLVGLQLNINGSGNMKLSTLLVADVVQDTHSLVCVHIYTHIFSLFDNCHSLTPLSLSLSLSLCTHLHTHTLSLCHSLTPLSLSLPFFLSLSPSFSLSVEEAGYCLLLFKDLKELPYILQ